MRRVAITGISGYLGNKLLQRLEQESGVESIIGIDCVLPKPSSQKLKFYQHDVRKPFSEIFADNEVDSAVHLAFIVKPSRDAASAHQVNIYGTRNFLEACRYPSVHWLAYLSSNTVYGGHPDNPIPISEGHPLRPPRDFPYSWDKALGEKMFRDFAEEHPEKLVAIVRCCPIIGPGGVGSGTTAMFTPLAIVRCAGYDPLWQFMHEDDITDLLLMMIRQKPSGIFNAAAEGQLRYSEIGSALGRRCVALPTGLVSAALRVSWRLHLQSRSNIGGLVFAKYPVVLSTERLKETIGFRCRYSSREALETYLRT